MALQGAALGETWCSGAQGDQNTGPRGETQVFQRSHLPGEGEFSQGGAF